VARRLHPRSVSVGGAVRSAAEPRGSWAVRNLNGAPGGLSHPCRVRVSQLPAHQFGWRTGAAGEPSARSRTHHIGPVGPGSRPARLGGDCTFRKGDSPPIAPRWGARNTKRGGKYSS
jgi:hypothetical protein